MVEGKPTDKISEVELGVDITEDVILNVTTQQVSFLVDAVNQSFKVAEKSDKGKH